jgi:hypothetical protein
MLAREYFDEETFQLVTKHSTNIEIKDHSNNIF